MELSLEMLEDAQEKQLHVREVPTVIRYDVPKGSNYTTRSRTASPCCPGPLSPSRKKPLLVLGLPGMGLFATGAAMGLNVAQNVTSTLDTFLGDGLTAIWAGVLGLSLMATGLVLKAFAAFCATSLSSTLASIEPVECVGPKPGPRSPSHGG